MTGEDEKSKTNRWRHNAFSAVETMLETSRRAQPRGPNLPVRLHLCVEERTVVGARASCEHETTTGFIRLVRPVQEAAGVPGCSAVS